MYFGLLLLSLHLLIVRASPDFLAALKHHEKRQTPQQALSACSIVLDVLSQCGNAIPGFVTMAPSAQAPCACYNAGATTTAWRPNVFDGAIETCASYASKNDPTVYTLLQPFNRLCNKVGDLRTVRAAPPPAACTSLLAALTSCNSETPGLSTLGAKSSARCLCYSQTTWLPNNFDGAVLTCGNYAKTASPSDYTVLQRLDGFCNSVGNVLDAPASTTRAITTTTPRVLVTTRPSTITTPPSRTSASLAGYITFPACSSAGSAIASCESASPGFTSAPLSSQAACICYTQSTSWVPERFDAAISSCGSFVETAEPEVYSIYSGLGEFCSSVGDIYNTAAGTTSARITNGGGGGGAGGLDANGIMGALSRTAGSQSSSSALSTVTVPNPAPATTTSRAGATPAAVADYWALKMISVVVLVQVLV